MARSRERPLLARRLFVAGRLSDRLSRRDPRWYARVPAIGLAASLPFALAFLLAPRPIALLALVPMGLTVSAWTAPTYAAAHALVDARMRSLVSAALLFGTNLVGMGAGPQVVGLLSDALAPRFGAEAIRWALVVAHVGIVASALLYAGAALDLASGLPREPPVCDDRMPALAAARLVRDNLYDVLTSRFPAPDAPCLTLLANGSVRTYGDLVRGAGRLARLLVGHGVGPGDRVVAQTAKSPEAVELYLATLRVGAVYVPLNTAYTESEVAAFVADAEPALVVRDAVALAAEAAALEPVVATTPRAGDDLAAIVYTSGTTGRSKGAMLSHGNLAANAIALHEAWGFAPDDVLLHALPIFHVHGLFVALHCALLSGGSMLWLPKFDEEQVLAALPRATVMMGVPTFYTRLLAHPGFTRDAAAHVRLFISGSAPLLPATFEEFERRTGMRILERYGMSEAAIITTNPLRGERIAGSVGYPLPGVELRIGGGTETGVIEIRGPSVFRGYWRMPEKTAEEFTADGFFVTGDVGRVDPDGRVWISGRVKDLVISGGYNVYPKEVELVLDEVDGVVESAVIGVPHPDFGEAVVAVVVGEAAEADVIAAARRRLAAYKAPKRVFFVGDLPRNAMGKVQKSALRKRYAETFAARGDRPDR